ncbi:MAG TPA: cardiolipin synthase [Clostridia bacterium]|nr:cardiolipin synthase [Clostridia bacterium]
MDLIILIKDFSFLLLFLYLVLLISVFSIITLANRDSYLTLLWLPLVILFPAWSFIFYLCLGLNISQNKLFNKLSSHYARYDLINGFKANQTEEAEELIPFRDRREKIFNLFLKNSSNPFTINNCAKVLTDGKETFREIEKSLLGAKNHIHLEYYIIRDDKLGNKVKNILIQKAKEGVEVRVIYDWLGSWGIRKRYIRELRAGGVEVCSFLPIRFPFPFFNSAINYRNHRKIIVVDGETGYLGGLNIGDEYIGAGKKFHHWRDTHLKIEGEAVSILQKIFLRDWYFVSNELISGNKYFPTINKQLGRQLIKIVPSGPDLKWKSILQAYFVILTSAKNYIYLTSPYLIPDESILMALKTAAASGVDVRIIIPGKPDKKIVYYASLSYLEELMEAGVKIYFYNKGFIHTKTLIVDGVVCSIGTANFDRRSFQLNFEVNAFIFSNQVVDKVQKDFEKDLQESKLINYEEYKNRPLSQKWLEAIFRLFSPFL